MAIAQVQKKEYVSTSDAFDHTLTFDSAPTAGNLLVFVFASYDFIREGPDAGSIVNRGDFVDVDIWYKIAKTGESSSFIFKYLPTAFPFCAHGFEYSGIMQLNPVDQSTGTTGQGGAGTLSSGTTGTTTIADELIIVAAGMRPECGGVSSWSNSFTSEFNSTSTGAADINIRLATGSRIVSSTGTYSSTATCVTNSIGHDCGAIATFKGMIPTSTAWFRG